MAPLTWRDVATPTFSGVSEANRLSAQLLGNGFANLQSTLGDFQKSRQTSVDADFLRSISQYTDPAQYDAAMREGLLNGSASADAIKVGMDRSGTLHRNASTDISNQTNRFNLSTAQRDDQQNQARIAAQPAAAELLGQARLLAGSGDPAKVEEARNMLQGNLSTLISAGYRADQIPGLLDAERSSGEQGFDYKRTVLANQKFWENQGISENAQNIAFGAINSNSTPEAAIRAIQEDRSITDPRIKEQAIKGVSAAKEAGIYYQPSELDILLQSSAPQRTAPQNNAAPQAQFALQNLAVKHESGGDYDTLFGHSQRDGNTFAGVKVSRQSIGQLKDFAALDGQYGQWVKSSLARSGQEARVATPMGKYQIVGTTLFQIAKEMGLSDDTVFSPQVQDAMFHHLVDKRISGPRTMEGKIAGLRAEWEGFKNVDNSTLAAAITAYENGDRGSLGSIAQGGGSDVPPSGSGDIYANATTPQIQAYAPTPAAQLMQSVAPTEPDPSLTTTSPGEGQSQGTQGAAAKGPRNPDLRSTDVPVDAPQANPARQLAEAVIPQAPQPAQAVPQAVPNNTTQVTIGSEPNSPVSQVTSELNTALNESKLDRIFHGNKALIQDILTPPAAGETGQQVAARLVREDGRIPGGNVQAVLQAINETIKMAGGSMDPHTAGTIVANNMESKDLTSWFLPEFMEGDRFSNDTESRRSALRTNMDGVKTDLKSLLGDNFIDKTGKPNLQVGMSQLRNHQTSDAVQQQLVQYQSALQNVVNQIRQLEYAINIGGQNTESNQNTLKLLMESYQAINAKINELTVSPSPTTMYSRSLPDLPTQ